MKAVFQFSFLLLIVAFVVSGCNIYDFTAANDDSRSLIEEGKD